MNLEKELSRLNKQYQTKEGSVPEFEKPPAALSDQVTQMVYKDSLLKSFLKTNHDV